VPVLAQHGNVGEHLAGLAHPMLISLPCSSLNTRTEPVRTMNMPSAGSPALQTVSPNQTSACAHCGQPLDLVARQRRGSPPSRGNRPSGSAAGDDAGTPAPAR
jgi:hypothetical protein